MMELIQIRLPASQEVYSFTPSSNKQNLTKEGDKNIRFRNCQAHHFWDRLYPLTCRDSFKIGNKNATARRKIGDLRGIVVESSKQTTMACAQAEPHPPKQPRCLISREFLHLRGGWWESNLFFLDFSLFYCMPSCISKSIPIKSVFPLFFFSPGCLEGGRFFLELLPTSSEQSMTVSTRLLHFSRKGWVTLGEGVRTPHYRNHFGNQHRRGSFT